MGLKRKISHLSQRLFTILRNLFIITALALSLFSSAQKMSKEFLKGEWTSNGEATEVLFSFTDKKEFNIQSVSSTSGRPLDVMSYQITKNTLYVKTYFEPNDFESITKFTIVDNNTMMADIVSEHPGQVIYKRVKKQLNK
jgi:hypothetical protein